MKHHRCEMKMNPQAVFITKSHIKNSDDFAVLFPLLTTPPKMYGVLFLHRMQVRPRVKTDIP
ncbi:Hypothetical protein, putative [Bodo saltans]|uniref:Uncharacterized protein n=1 Tax=Bodo saltans TaxID=75058 RepID=A0A0S4IX56_BODSA|nr:Hypothetical protein, putative [Bodo saltans]|eukprot:CUF87762.1 Hypothetical protein, putative [Bodo saltans]